MREFGDPVARARRPRRELAGHGPVAGMKRKRLFRRQAAVRAETRFQIRGTEAPEGRVPGGTVALYFVRAAWDVPALDDFLQEAVAQEALPVRARQVARPDRPRLFRGLEIPQDFEGPREFFRGSGHSRLPSGFVLPLSDCVVLYYTIALSVNYPITLYRFHLNVSRQDLVRQVDWRRRGSPFAEASDPGGSRNGSTEMRS